MGRPGKKRDRLSTVALAEETLHPTFIGGSDLDLVTCDPNGPEQMFAARVPLARRRRLGQFFTPPAIADLMCRWLFLNDSRRRSRQCLDPSAGPGIFVRTMLEQDANCQITAIDIDPFALQILRGSLGECSSVEMLSTDFLTWTSDQQFDAIVANPPYLRHHDLNYAEDIFRTIGKRNGILLSRLTNAYGLFILEICRRLREGGRAAIITPGEWLNANFGQPIKEYLLKQVLLKHLVYFSHAATVFDDALTTACLLLIEKAPTRAQMKTVHTLYVRPHAALVAVEDALQTPHASHSDVISRHLTPRMLLEHPKWDALLELGAASTPKGFVPIGELASSCRGIATGANSFFHINGDMRSLERISARHAKPCVGRAADVGSLVFTRRDFSQMMARNQRSHLLQFEKPLSPSDRRYLQKGESQGLPERYLLAARSPWYRMEQREAAPIWAAVFGRQQLRFIWNAGGILNLTTFHGIYPHRRDRYFVQALVACLNSRIVQKLARHHQRVYGGGLIKFEPRDLLAIEVPNLLVVSKKTVRELAECLGRLDGVLRAGGDVEVIHAMLDERVRAAASEAHKHVVKEFSEAR